MQARDGVFLEDLCPKLRARRWRQELHQLTDHRCLYCGAASESIDHVFPRSRGGLSSDDNCVPACLDCNGQKGDSDAFSWYRSQGFYDPRRAMALRAWVQGDLQLARRLLSWTQPLPQRAERAGEGRRRDGVSLEGTTPLGRSRGRLSGRSSGEGRLASGRSGEARAGDSAVEAVPGRRRRAQAEPLRQSMTEEPLSEPLQGQPAPPQVPPRRRRHQTRQAASPLWRWQMAS